MNGEPTEDRGIEQRGDTATMMVDLKKKSGDLYDLANALAGRKLDDKPTPEQRRQFWELVQRELPALNDKLQKLIDAGTEIADL